MKTRLSLAFAIILIISATKTISQNGVAINSTNSAPDSSAMLDVSSSAKGILIPRMTNAEKNAISNPAKSLIVFQTDGTAGFYYYTGTAWKYMASDNLGNHTATDSMNMSNNKIVNLATCTHNLDAANKEYVDNTVAAGGGGGGLYIGQHYQGGIIFWIDGSGQHGLIASPNDNARDIVWSNINNVEIGEEAQHTEDGQANTTAIVSQPGFTDGAAIVCDTLNIVDGGTTYSDWYLPSINEGNLMLTNRQSIGNFHYRGYWSSTETHSSAAFYFETDSWAPDYYYYDNGKQYGSWMSVRCIRKF